MAASNRQACGCESRTNRSGAEVQSAWCGEHAGNGGTTGRYGCGECGFQARSFEDLQTHVYGEHLGADVA
jgi:hypothetical protein